MEADARREEAARRERIAMMELASFRISRNPHIHSQEPLAATSLAATSLALPAAPTADRDVPDPGGNDGSSGINLRAILSCTVPSEMALPTQR